MTIKVGDRIPDVTLYVMSEEGPQTVKTGELFKGKKVALFALPGAFTPTCSAKHLPGFIERHAELKNKGIDLIACLSVNDAFVMGAWGKQQNVGDKVMMLADGSAEFTKAIGMEFDLSARGLGLRSQRYSMLIEDGVVKTLNLEKPGAFEVSDANTLLSQL
ncbi:peroxiredoxin [uncultured Ferrovibrio sp.]|jgi:peroxiredoxin|uniref:peroxiredoxin n=1 Tax=uncultured Ferrovibrio sp. TaxID=1576913 RepID=UPI00263672C1|nr:peroxiredoxin [uncultured Ferrovibrio sp.]